MKKLVLALICIMLITFDSRAQWRIGPEIGLNLSNIREDYSGLYLPNNILAGAKAGCVLDYEYNDNFAFQPGIYFSMMGCFKQGSNTYFYGITTVNPDTTTTISYIHIPINFVYKAGLGRGRFFVGAGPYVSYGILGTYKSDAYNVGVQSAPAKNESIKFGSDTSSIKVFDYGLDITAGYEFPRGFFFRAGYSYGFGNMSNKGSITANNTCIFISIGLLLGGPSYR